VRDKALGKKAGRPAQAIVYLEDYFNETTGFTAMERTTGWDAAMVAEMMAHGQTFYWAGSVRVLCQHSHLGMSCANGFSHPGNCGTGVVLLSGNFLGSLIFPIAIKTSIDSRASGRNFLRGGRAGTPMAA